MTIPKGGAFVHAVGPIWQADKPTDDDVAAVRRPLERMGAGDVAEMIGVEE